MTPQHLITVNRPTHGPLSIRVQIDACLSPAEALALRAELDRAISAIQGERQMLGIVEEAARQAAARRIKTVAFTFDESNLSPLENMTGGGIEPPIDPVRRPQGNETNE